MEIEKMKILHNKMKRMLEEDKPVYVFGYGSLLWKTDFTYQEKKVGYIEGYKRRFWQGNTTHRGTKENKGRVATVIPTDKKHCVWGELFVVTNPEDKEKALSGLTDREMTLGGYDFQQTTFYSRDGEKISDVGVFMATSDNKLFLGKASYEDMAMQIFQATGPCGTNVEYVTRTADYVRKNIPEDSDKHLFNLDEHVRKLDRQFRSQGE